MRLSVEEYVSWKYRMEHHMSKDTVQAASQVLLQIVVILKDLIKEGMKIFQFYLDGAPQQYHYNFNLCLL